MKLLEPIHLLISMHKKIW